MEALYQYLWKYNMVGRRLRLPSGQPVEVIDPGRLNTDAGPDFFNAKIKVGDTEWAGNVEIHVKASDWRRHNHDGDPAYDNIILHVVAIDDAVVRRSDGSVVPQVTLTLPEGFFSTYAALQSGPDDIRCRSLLCEVPPLAATSWLEALCVERLQVKADRILAMLRTYSGDWQQATFVALARALGFGLNGEPFEMLAKSLNLNYLARHSDSLMQLEALLFGQAGMLDPSAHIFDEYYQLLCREYYFLARKYSLRPMRPGVWKYARTRPGNFPHRRVALLARFLLGGFSLFQQVIDARGDSDELRSLLTLHLDGYWKDHFSFDVESRPFADTMSARSLDVLLINLAAPLYYAYGASIGNPDFAEKGLDLLNELPPENNSIVRQWQSLGLKAASAARSQALIHLRREYCDSRKCLYCRFGHLLLRKEAGAL